MSHSSIVPFMELQRLTLPCKAKKQYLLTLQVSRYLILALQSLTAGSVFFQVIFQATFHVNALCLCKAKKAVSVYF